MYRYDEFDERFVRERVAQFRDQVTRRLDGSPTASEWERSFKGSLRATSMPAMARLQHQHAGGRRSQ